MSVFTSQIRNKPWVWQVTTMGVLLGGLLAAALKTQDQIRKEQLPTTRISGLAAAYSDLRETVAAQKKKIADLQASLNRSQDAVNVESKTTKLLKEDLSKANILAGTVSVTGPGVIVTLRDSKNPPERTPEMTPDEYQELAKLYLIHDQDIQTVLNELRAAGAEAIAVNDQRVIATTAVRCTGPSVLVNGTSTNPSPVRIKAIGDPDAIVAGMTMTGGVSDTYKITDPSMFSIDKVKSLTVPAYAGPTPNRFAKPAPEHKAEQAQKQSEDAAESDQER